MREGVSERQSPLHDLSRNEDFKFAHPMSTMNRYRYRHTHTQTHTLKSARLSRPNSNVKIEIQPPEIKFIHNSFDGQ